MFYHSGICNNVGCEIPEAAFKLLESAIKSWPESLGSTYPVEGSAALYNDSADNGTIWQNPKRLALLDHLITYTKGD